MTVYKLVTCFNNYRTTYFVTLTDAYNYIRTVEYDDICALYEVTTSVEEGGIITATEKRLPRPKSAREIKYGRGDKNESYID